MTTLSFKDRVKHAIALGGTSVLTLGSAASGHQAFDAGDDGLVFPYVIEDGSAWEIGLGTYTNSGTSFARTSVFATSSGSSMSVSTSAILYVDISSPILQSMDRVTRTYITGLTIYKGAGNTINVDFGYAYVPAAGRLVSSGGTNLDPGSLGASQWGQVYLAETGSLQFVNNADPPSTTYLGNARQGGTNGNRRWLGSYLTDASGNIRVVQASEFAPGVMLVQYNADINLGAPFRVLSAGAATSFTSASLAGIVPRYATIDVLFNAYITTGTGGTAIGLSNDGATLNIGTIQSPPVASGAFLSSVLWVPPKRATPEIFYSVGSGQAAYLDVAAYKVAR